VDRIDVVADAGYFRTKDIAACEEAGLTPYVPRPERGYLARNSFFRKDEFRYDAERDAYVCPAGHVLATRYESKLRDTKKVDYSNRAACLVGPPRSRCTNEFRQVSRLEHEDALDRMAAHLKARPEILDRRRETVEHPFGSIKQRMVQGAFLMRGLEKVRRLQPDGARLEFAAGAQQSRHGQVDGGRVIGARIAPFCGKPAQAGALHPFQDATGVISGRDA
jgi:Transposase DDE domain